MLLRPIEQHPTEVLSFFSTTQVRPSLIYLRFKTIFSRCFLALRFVDSVKTAKLAKNGGKCGRQMAKTQLAWHAKTVLISVLLDDAGRQARYARTSSIFCNAPFRHFLCFEARTTKFLKMHSSYAFDLFLFS